MSGCWVDLNSRSPVSKISRLELYQPFQSSSPKKDDSRMGSFLQGSQSTIYSERDRRRGTWFLIVNNAHYRAYKWTNKWANKSVDAEQIWTGVGDEDWKGWYSSYLEILDYLTGKGGQRPGKASKQQRGTERSCGVLDFKCGWR